MITSTIEYKRKVWDLLERMKPHERYKVARLALPENREMFVEYVREYMRSFPYQGWISFNFDFSEFYKSTRVPEEQLQRSKR